MKVVCIQWRDCAKHVGCIHKLGEENNEAKRMLREKDFGNLGLLEAKKWDCYKEIR